MAKASFLLRRLSLRTWLVDIACSYMLRQLFQACNLSPQSNPPVQVSAQLIEAVIVLANPNYAPAGWQTAMLAWGALGVAMFANTVLFRKLPLVEGIIMFVHVFGFFAVVIVLWYVPKSKVE